MNQRKPRRSTMDMMLLSLLRVQDNYILPKWCEETAGLFCCPEDGKLHIPITISTHVQPFLLWVKVPG